LSLNDVTSSVLAPWLSTTELTHCNGQCQVCFLQKCCDILFYNFWIPAVSMGKPQMTSHWAISNCCYSIMNRVSRISPLPKSPSWLWFPWVHEPDQLRYDSWPNSSIRNSRTNSGVCGF
jgi:hypothetical protein